MPQNYRERDVRGAGAQRVPEEEALRDLQRELGNDWGKVWSWRDRKGSEQLALRLGGLLVSRERTTSWGQGTEAAPQSAVGHSQAFGFWPNNTEGPQMCCEQGRSAAN